jgi:epsilon-lactone hydrolase
MNFGPTHCAAVLFAMLLQALPSTAEESLADASDNSLINVPAFDLPFSGLASEEARQQFASERSPAFAESPVARMHGLPIMDQRRILDEHYLQPRIEKALELYEASIEPDELGGVYVEIIEPAMGVPLKHRDKVLINLHGGGFTMGARTNGQLESVPVAVTGGFRVVAVDYRQGPEHQFPAASEDVEKVYRALLQTYAAENIGIFGCSAGGILAAQSLAWFQQQSLPTPGAVGIFCAGAGVLNEGDSMYLASAANGRPIPRVDNPSRVRQTGYFSETDLEGPLVTPVRHPDVLAKFPPTLLVNSTRDFTLSGALYTHRQLINNGVEADLHVWDGLQHYFFKDMELPETHEAIKTMARFFQLHLGTNNTQE